MEDASVGILCNMASPLGGDFKSLGDDVGRGEVEIWTKNLKIGWFVAPLCPMKNTDGANTLIHVVVEV